MRKSPVVLWEVDTQEDFMLPGGKLYVPGAEKILPNIDRLVGLARVGRVLLVSDACEHSPDDPEFKTFPPHCIRGTLGARIVPEGLARTVYSIPNHPDAKLPDSIFENQQINLEKQTLDVFDNPHAETMVNLLGRDAAYMVFGVVTEHCVRLAAKGLLDRGCKVSVIKDAIETLNATEGQRTLDELRLHGAKLISTDEAIAAVGRESAR
jgi:nicotinamidase/pyrazinamidase